MGNKIKQSNLLTTKPAKAKFATAKYFLIMLYCCFAKKDILNQKEKMMIRLN